MIGPADVLYSFRRCPYAMRARMALKLARANPSVREVDLKAKPAALLAASPKGTVPVLVLKAGIVLEQSLDIMRHALGLCDPSGVMEGDTERGRAIIAENDGPFKAALDRYKYPDRYAGEDVSGAEKACAAFYARLEAGLGGGFLCGGRAGFADIAVFPFIRQAAFVNPAAFAALPYPKLQGWLERMMAMPEFAAIMKPLPVWQEGTEEPEFQDVFEVRCTDCDA